MSSELLLGLSLLLFAFAHFRIVRNRTGGFLLSDVALWMTMAAVGTAPFIAHLFGSGDLASASVMGTSYLAFALYGLGLVVAGFLFGQRVFLARDATSESSAGSLFYCVERARLVPTAHMVGALAIFITARVYTFASGGGITGLNSAEVMQSQSYALVVLNQLVASFPTVLVILSLILIQSRQRLYLAIPAVVIVGALTLTEGRRSVIYLFVLISLVLAALRGHRFLMRHLALAAVGVGFALTVFSPIYLGFRNAIYVEALSGIGTVSEMAGAVNRALAQTRLEDEEGLTERSAANLRSRGLGLRTVVYEILAAQDFYTPLWGRAFVQHQLTGVPRYFRGQDSFPQNPKNFTQRAFGLFEGDATYSITAAGIADFGLAGASLAGVFMGTFLNVGTIITIKIYRRLPFAALVLFAALWNVAVNPEINPGFEMQMVRNMVIVIGLMSFLRSMGFRMTNQLGLAAAGSANAHARQAA